jgi:ABC-type phosphate transport system substrate-binding protein
MNRARIRAVLLLLVLAVTTVDTRAIEGVVVIGHASIKRMDVTTLARIYTGRVIEVDGIAITAVNAKPGTEIRTRFLQMFLNQDEDKYIAYWTVRRYIGKGTAPREMSTSSEVIRFVTSTPGAIGYIDSADLQPGLNVLLR